MADKLKEIPAKILEWWNKFTKKQKIIIIAIVAVVVLTFAILVWAFSKPQYTKIGTYSNTAESAQIVDILDDAGITHRESSDALTNRGGNQPALSGKSGAGSCRDCIGQLKTV